MNLYNLGLTGINAASAGLNTASHNINNIDTAGYNRQQVLVSTAGGSLTGSGYFGRGVSVDTVSRQYNNYLYTQLVSARSQQASLSAYSSEIGQINDMLGTSTEGVSYALGKFFDSVQAVATQPSDPAARQDMIGQANTLVTQINEAQRMLKNQADNVNGQISTTVSQINSYVERIANLNQQVTEARAASGGQEPNDLLDQRDQLVSELGQLIGVRAVEQGSSLTLTTGNGQVLLAGTTTYALQAKASDADPSRIVVAYTLPDGKGGSQAIEFDESKLTGGSLGGLVAFRRETLDVAQNDLGRIAVGLATAFNQQNEAGLTLDGEPGGRLFEIADPVLHANSRNSGSAAVSVAWGDVGQLTASDYEISYNASTNSYRVVGTQDGFEGEFAPSDQPQVINGLQITLPTGAADGDKWVVQPTRQAAASLSVAVTDPAAIAAADRTGGSSNNANALAMAQLQTSKTLAGGTLSLTDAYTQIVNKIGVKTQAVETAGTAASNLVTQRLTAQQAVSGVSLEEEQISLMQYAEQYQASARIISVASELFDTLLGLQ